MELYDRDISAIQKAQIKQVRDRKSDPQTIMRNVEICDLRHRDPREWSQVTRFSALRCNARRVPMRDTSNIAGGKKKPEAANRRRLLATCTLRYET
jgi:hypothetical protein